MMLTSMMVSPAYIPPIASMDALIKAIKDQQYVLDLLSPNFGYYGDIMESTDQQMMALKEAMTENPPIFSQVDRQAYTVESRPIVTIGGRIYMLPRLLGYLGCDQELVTAAGMNNLPIGFPITPHNVSLLNRFNTAIRGMYNMLLVELRKYEKAMLVRVEQCRREKHTELTKSMDPAQPIYLHSILGAVVLLAVGLGIGLIGILVERIVFAFTQTQT